MTSILHELRRFPEICHSQKRYDTCDASTDTTHTYIVTPTRQQRKTHEKVVTLSPTQSKGTFSDAPYDYLFVPRPLFIVPTLQRPGPMRKAVLPELRPGYGF